MTTIVIDTETYLQHANKQAAFYAFAWASNRGLTRIRTSTRQRKRARREHRRAARNLVAWHIAPWHLKKARNG